VEPVGDQMRVNNRRQQRDGFDATYVGLQEASNDEIEAKSIVSDFYGTDMFKRNLGDSVTFGIKLAAVAEIPAG
jgi:hypothetical protein